ncbi:MAG: hypothetical protein Q9162_003812 [Coniocarpon cinnabarinum]
MTSKFTLSTSGTLKFGTDSDVSLHVQPLQENPTTITTLDLSGTSLGVSACTYLATLVPNLSNLTHANLADIFTSRLLSEIPPAIDALLTSLLQLPQLRTVNLSDNAFGLNTASPLVKYLEKATSLRHLILQNNGLGPEAGTLVANALTRLAEAKSKSSDTEHQCQLETIICGRNRLENGSMTAWAQAVQTHGKRLREIKMVQNGIRQEGIQVLLRDGLRHCEELRVLDLQDNTFTKTGARALSEVLTRWTQLQEMGVSDCLLSARGMVLVGEALQKGSNKSLEVCKLQYDEIDTRGLNALVAAAESGALPALRRVELNGNVLAEEDPSIEKLRDLLNERREKAGKGDEPDPDDDWGLDELDELEEPESEAEDDEKEADDEGEEIDKREAADKGERELKQVDEAENENVSPAKDAEVDALADKLGKTGL